MSLSLDLEATRSHQPFALSPESVLQVMKTREWSQSCTEMPEAMTFSSRHLELIIIK